MLGAAVGTKVDGEGVGTNEGIADGAIVGTVLGTGDANDAEQETE